MQPKNLYSIIFASAIALSALNASANSTSVSAENNLLQVSVDSIGNYHIYFHTHDLSTSTAAQENEEKEFYRSFLTNRNRVTGELATTEERIDGFINATEYFTKESPRPFSLKPRGEMRETEEHGKAQSYTFCVYFGPATKSTSCMHTWFSIDQFDLLTALDTAEIAYEFDSTDRLELKSRFELR